MASRLVAEKTIPFGSVGAVDFKNRTFEGWATVPEIDRDREYLPLDAITKHFPAYIQNNAVLLLGHQHKTTVDSLPIGKCIDYKFHDDGLWTKYYVTRRPIGDDILILLDEGILKGLSMGFVPLDFVPNPSDHQLPSFVRGKGLKKFYKEVETVEISLLSIPSNRQSLVIAAENGNRVASMITKGWQGGDITPIIKAWLAEGEEEKLEEKSLDETVWHGFVSKIFDWNESEHPRDDEGQFTFSGRRNTIAPYSEFTRPGNRNSHEEINAKLDTIIQNNTKMQADIDKVKDKDGWANWTKKWIVRIGVLTGLYYGIKHFVKSPEVKRKIKDWLVDMMQKEYGSDDVTEKFLHVMTFVKHVLDKGHEIGAAETSEYKKLQTFYDKTLAQLKIVAETEEKGLSQLWTTKEVSTKHFNELNIDVTKRREAKLTVKVLLTDILTKDWTEEDEKKHPRAPKGAEHGGRFISIDKVKETAQGVVETVKEKAKAHPIITVVGGTIGGYKIYRKSSLWLRKENIQQVKKTVEEIAQASHAPNKEAIENIANIRVYNNIYNSKSLSDESRELISYINGDNFQKDLAAKFGHLDGIGCKKFYVFNDYEMQITAPLRMFAKKSITYYQTDDAIFINLAFLDRAKYLLKKTGISTKDIIFHEYTHSIVSAHPKIMEKHLADMEKFGKSLVGKKLGLKYGGIADILGSENRDKVIEGFKSNGLPAEGVYTILGGHAREMEVPKIMKTFATPKRYDKNAIDYAWVYHLQDEEGNIHFLDMGQTMHLVEGGQPMVAGSMFHDKTESNVDERLLYGLNRLNEWCAVKVEKGGQL